MAKKEQAQATVRLPPISFDAETVVAKVKAAVEREITLRQQEIIDRAVADLKSIIDARIQEVMISLALTEAHKALNRAISDRAIGVEFKQHAVDRIKFYIDQLAQQRAKEALR